MDCILYGGWDRQIHQVFWGHGASHEFFDIFCSPNSFEAARMGEVPTSCSSKEPILAGSAGCSGGAGGRLKMILLRIASIYRRPQKVLEKDQMNIVEIHLHLSLGSRVTWMRSSTKMKSMSCHVDDVESHQPIDILLQKIKKVANISKFCMFFFHPWDPQPKLGPHRIFQAPNSEQSPWPRTGRDKEELVVTRAEEHRERLEVMELLDRAGSPKDPKGLWWLCQLSGVLFLHR